MSLHPFFEILGVIVTKEISLGALSVLYTPNLETCSFSANNWGKGNDIMFVLRTVALPQDRESFEWLQSRSPDVFLPSFDVFVLSV